MWKIGTRSPGSSPPAYEASKSTIQDLDDEFDYLNDAQLDEHFKGNDEDKEDHKARCRALGLWRPSPEYPHKEHLTEFWTRVKTKARNRQRARNDEELHIKANVDAQGAHDLMTKGPFAHPIPTVPGVSAINQINCWPPTVPSSMFQTAPPAAARLGGAAAVAQGAAAAPAGGAAPAAGEAPAGAAPVAGETADPVKQKTRAKAKAKVAKPLSADTIHAVAQKWAGVIMSEVAKARSTKGDLAAHKFGSQMVQELENWAIKLMGVHEQIQNLLSKGSVDVEAYRAFMEKGDELKKAFNDDFKTAKSLLGTKKGGKKDKTGGKP